jgi:hypothetical protein
MEPRSLRTIKYEEFAMRRPAYNDRLDSNDRKKIRRIFYQMVGLYMSLVVIAIAGVAAPISLYDVA